MHARVLVGMQRGVFRTPIACPTSDTSAPVTSHSAEMELIDEMRWARKAFAVSLDSSADLAERGREGRRG